MAHTPEARADAWRVFPWDSEAAPDDPFSPAWVPPSQGQGRFDLPGTPGGVIYMAESPEHAVAEMIQHYRGQTLDSADLRVAGRPLAIARITIGDRVMAEVADLCDPAVLSRLGIRPDETASSNRLTTQRIAAQLHAGGHTGLRWWSALTGDWHTLVLFRDRMQNQLRFGQSEALSLSHAAVIEAARALGIAIAPR
ncbi:MAG: RES family NAD+ phosphorylase [Longimicrobiales bacterium]